MEQHPIPRQITSFEFKLIGFMTLKQFLYLVVFFPLGFVVFKIVPFPFVNIALGVITAIIGVVLAFVPIQDRPIDVWVRNMFKRLTSPTQYSYHKDNPVLYFLKDLYFLSDPHKVVSHIESQEKLLAYLAQRRQQGSSNTRQKQQIQSLLRQPTTVTGGQKTVVQPISGAPQNPIAQPQSASISSPSPSPQVNLTDLTGNNVRQPFFIGSVKNNKQFPIPGILIYIKDQQNNPLRLMKTNPNGVFATYSPIPAGDYKVELKDPNANYFFDTMKVRIETENTTPFEFYSKELL